MNFLAVTPAPAAATTIDKLKAIPPEFWLRLGVAVVALILLVIVLRKVAKMNKVVLAAVTFVVVTIVGFNWIYERSEPAWATPVVSFLANWFPTKGPPGKTIPAKPAPAMARK
jgi:apolipoprotein N-acyltransferase